jgi:hypothetical protein
LARTVQPTNTELIVVATSGGFFDNKSSDGGIGSNTHNFKVTATGNGFTNNGHSAVTTTFEATGNMTESTV